jgi:hypothetical protein
MMETITVPVSAGLVTSVSIILSEFTSQIVYLIASHMLFIEHFETGVICIRIFQAE